LQLPHVQTASTCKFNIQPYQAGHSSFSLSRCAIKEKRGASAIKQLPFMAADEMIISLSQPATRAANNKNHTIQIFFPLSA
jgi:hypothetical protein